MMSLEKVDLDRFSVLTYPMITPLITCATKENENVMAATWTTPVSVNPPRYGISIGQNHYSHQLIKESGEFGVCFLDFQEVRKVLQAGRSSGKEVNKFEKFDLKKKKSSVITAPLLKNAYSALECRVKRELKLKETTFFLGEVVASWVRKEIFKEKTLNLQKFKPILYLGYNTFGTTQEWDKRIEK